MKLQSVRQLTPGQAIGQPLFDEKEQVLINKGTRLTDYMIKRLIAMMHSLNRVILTDLSVPSAE